MKNVRLLIADDDAHFLRYHGDLLRRLLHSGDRERRDSPDCGGSGV